MRDGIGQSTAKTAGGDAGNDAGFDVLDERRVYVGQAGGGQFEVFKAHLGQFVYHQIHHFVAAAEVMVEGNGLAILQPGALDGFFQAY